MTLDELCAVIDARIQELKDEIQALEAARVALTGKRRPGRPAHQ